MAGESRPLPDAVVAALHRGNKIAAIKLLHEAWNLADGNEARAARQGRRGGGLGLKEAKDHIEAHIAADPVLSRKIRSTTVSGARGCLFWLILLLFIGFGAWQLFSGR